MSVIIFVHNKQLCINMIYKKIMITFPINILLILLHNSKLYLCQEEVDYWNGDFDEDKNCEKEELMAKLMEDGKMDRRYRCATKRGGNHMNIQHHWYPFCASNIHAFVYIFHILILISILVILDIRCIKQPCIFNFTDTTDFYFG